MFQHISSDFFQEIKFFLKESRLCLQNKSLNKNTNHPCLLAQVDFPNSLWPWASHEDSILHLKKHLAFSPKAAETNIAILEVGKVLIR